MLNSGFSIGDSVFLQQDVSIGCYSSHQPVVVKAKIQKSLLDSVE